MSIIVIIFSLQTLIFLLEIEKKFLIIFNIEKKVSSIFGFGIIFSGMIKTIKNCYNLKEKLLNGFDWI